MNVAIVGIGIHPFGRHPGVSGLDQGASAAREALADAGVGWTDCSSRSAAAWRPATPTPWSATSA